MQISDDDLFVVDSSEEGSMPVINNWYCPKCDRNLASGDVSGSSEGTAQHRECGAIVQRRSQDLKSLKDCPEIKVTEEP